MTLAPTHGLSAAALCRTLDATLTTLPADATLAWDLDGVFYDLLPPLRTHIHRRGTHPTGDLPDPPTYDLAAAWNITPADLLDHLVHGTLHGDLFATGALYDDAHTCLTTIRERRPDLRHVAVTARDLPGATTEATAQTHRWLHDHGITFDAVHLTAVKTAVAFDLLLDDAPANVAAAHAAGRAALLVDRPWNQDVTTRRTRLLA